MWAVWGKDGDQDKIRVSSRKSRKKEMSVRQVTSNVNYSLFLHEIYSLVVKQKSKAKVTVQCDKDNHSTLDKAHDELQDFFLIRQGVQRKFPKRSDA